MCNPVPACVSIEQGWSSQPEAREVSGADERDVHWRAFAACRITPDTETLRYD
jgi:hypothetical protein